MTAFSPAEIAIANSFVNESQGWILANNSFVDTEYLRDAENISIIIESRRVGLRNSHLLERRMYSVG